MPFLWAGLVLGGLTESPVETKINIGGRHICQLSHNSVFDSVSWVAEKEGSVGNYNPTVDCFDGFPHEMVTQELTGWLPAGIGR